MFSGMDSGEWLYPELDHHVQQQHGHDHEHQQQQQPQQQTNQVNNEAVFIQHHQYMPSSFDVATTNTNAASTSAESPGIPSASSGTTQIRSQSSPLPAGVTLPWQLDAPLATQNQPRAAPQAPVQGYYNGQHVMPGLGPAHPSWRPAYENSNMTTAEEPNTRYQPGYSGFFDNPQRMNDNVNQSPYYAEQHSLSQQQQRQREQYQQQFEYLQQEQRRLEELQQRQQQEQQQQRQQQAQQQQQRQREQQQQQEQPNRQLQHLSAQQRQQSQTSSYEPQPHLVSDVQQLSLEEFYRRYSHPLDLQRGQSQFKLQDQNQVPSQNQNQTQNRQLHVQNTIDQSQDSPQVLKILRRGSDQPLLQPQLQQSQSLPAAEKPKGKIRKRDDSDAAAPAKKRATETSKPRKVLPPKTPLEILQDKVQQVFKDFKDFPTLRDQFKEIILACDKNKFGEGDPDEIQLVLETALKQANSTKLWTYFKGDSAFITRLRNWMAELVRSKKYDNTQAALRVFQKIPRTEREMEIYKLKKVIGLLIKNGNSTTTKLAEMVGNSVEKNAVQESQNRAKTLGATTTTKAVKPAAPSVPTKKPEPVKTEGGIFNVLQNQKNNAPSRPKPVVPPIKTTKLKEEDSTDSDAIENPGTFSSYLKNIKNSNQHSAPKPSGNSDDNPQRPRKPKKKVHWPESNEDLERVKYFEMDPIEMAQRRRRVNDIAAGEMAIAEGNAWKSHGLAAHEVEWYQPLKYQDMGGFRHSAQVSIKRGGTLIPHSEAANLEFERESHTLISADIKDSPSEPDHLPHLPSMSESTIALAPELTHHPAIQQLKAQSSAAVPSAEDLQRLLQSVQPARNGTYQNPGVQQNPESNDRFHNDHKRGFMALRQTDIRPKVRKITSYDELRYRTPCHFYESPAGCKRGDECSFIHQQK